MLLVSVVVCVCSAWNFHHCHLYRFSPQSIAIPVFLFSFLHNYIYKSFNRSFSLHTPNFLTLFPPLMIVHSHNSLPLLFKEILFGLWNWSPPYHWLSRYNRLLARISFRCPIFWFQLQDLCFSLNWMSSGMHFYMFFVQKLGFCAVACLQLHPITVAVFSSVTKNGFLIRWWIFELTALVLTFRFSL